jgi:hypothetical protein
MGHGTKNQTDMQFPSLQGAIVEKYRLSGDMAPRRIMGEGLGFHGVLLGLC